MSALHRQWMILKQIPHEPRKIDAARLEARLREAGCAMHRRTIQRDLTSLSRLFPLVRNERSKPYGWSWSKDAAQLSIPGMGPHVALLLVLASRRLVKLLPKETAAFVARHLPAAHHVLKTADPRRLRAASRRRGRGRGDRDQAS